MIISVNLVPTEICKWNCNYCIFPLIQNPKSTTEQIIDRHYKYIKDVFNKLRKNNFEVQISFQGGEVGELNKETTKYLLNKFNEKIIVSTNGLFLEKKYHLDLDIRKYIKKVHWHVSPDCELIKIKDFNDDTLEIIRGIVHKSKTKLDDFILYNKEKLNIEYHEIENPLNEKSIISTDIIGKCRNYHDGITIDLVNENLCLCIRNFKNITIPLNEYNFTKLLTSFSKDIFSLPEVKNSSCYSCCRLCVSKTNQKIIENKIKYMKIFRN